ncbi:MAG: penicillin-binding protein 2 [bacterium]|nr:penicillin-binding protein 2 [bacterium]
MNYSDLDYARVRRYKLVFSAFLLGAASLAAHLFFLQLHGPTHRLYETKVEQRWHSYECPQGRRGDIFYRDGTLLAGTRKVAKVIIEPLMVKDQLTNVSETLAMYLGRPAEDIAAEISNFKRRGMELASGIDLGTALQIDRAGMPGVFTRYYCERIYPAGDYSAGATLGFAGTEPHQRLGLESSCDVILSGEDGKVIYRKDANRQRLPDSVLASKERRDGSPLYTTLHPSIQTICEDELRAGLGKNHAEWGCIVVMDPRSGDVLGASTYPTFDPNEYVRGGHGPEGNVLVHNAVEPGSTVKPLLAAYALDREWLSPQQKFVCNRSYRVGKYNIREAEADEVIGGNGGVSIDDILVKSSNIGMAQVALQLGQDHVREAYGALGFFSRTGVELPSESRGIRPCSWLKKGEKWPKITLATTGYGHGMSVTPLQLATAYCTIANGGYRVQPTLLLRDNDAAPVDEKVELPEGEIIMAGIATSNAPAVQLYTPQMAADGRVRVLSAETCQMLTTWLERVVTKGTGRRAKLDRYRAAGKTGTATISGKGGGYASGAYLSSFVGYFPAEQPRYVVLVMFNRPRGAYYGGAVSAPVFKKVGDRISYIDELQLRGSEY